jgi:hypothetical protein
LMMCVIDSPGLNHVVSQGEATGASSEVMADTPIARPAVSNPKLLHGVAADNRLTRKVGRFHCPTSRRRAIKVVRVRNMMPTSVQGQRQTSCT